MNTYQISIWPVYAAINIAAAGARVLAEKAFRLSRGTTKTSEIPGTK